MSRVTAPQALEELSYKSKRLKDNTAVTRELIGQKKEQGEKNVLVQSIKGAHYDVYSECWVFSPRPPLSHFNCAFLSDECQMFEDWLQDAQLTVNECFENPETRADVQVSMQRLQVSKLVICLTVGAVVINLHCLTRQI